MSEAASPPSQDDAPAQRASLGRGVARGGLWNLGGQVAVLLASLIATPFVVRLLAPELYGLLSLIQALVAYLAFAALGTSLASTKIGAEAFARGDDEGEVAVVWTSLAIVAVPALLSGLAFTAAAHPLMRALSVPPELQDQGTLALRIAVIGFVARALYSCINTPQTVRLRWDLITKIESFTAVTQIALIPIVLALGGGLVAAVTIASGATVLRVVLHTLSSRRLQPLLLRPRFRRQLVGRLLRFGGALAISDIVMIPLRTVDRLFVARYTSVSEVAFYSLAVTVATMLSVFPTAISHPLLPAFTRLRASAKPVSLQALYLQATRGIFLFTVPAMVLLWLVARPAFTIWGGPDYGRNSTVPFCILAVGLAANAVAYPSIIVLMAADRANVMARFYLIELLPYVAISALLTARFGTIGAAVAYSMRMFGDWIFFSAAAKRVASLSVSPLPASRRWYGVALAVLLFPPLITRAVLPLSVVTFLVAVGAVIGHAFIVFTQVLTDEEVGWVRGLSTSVRRRLPAGRR